MKNSNNRDISRNHVKEDCQAECIKISSKWPLIALGESADFVGIPDDTIFTEGAPGQGDAHSLHIESLVLLASTSDVEKARAGTPIELTV